MQPQAGEFEHMWVIDLVRDEIENGLRFKSISRLSSFPALVTCMPFFHMI